METNLVSVTLLVGLLAAACLINVPLGYLRSRQRKFSAKWFLFVHLSIPLLYLARTRAGFGYWAIPLFVLAAVAGQILGGRIGQKTTAA
jgi:hypothetical protein